VRERLDERLAAALGSGELAELHARGARLAINDALALATSA
jgi:hypothetical protein